MRKYVYLFELDSVRKTDDEIITGQKALYDEIVLNGNIVVLTYNQLVDSRGFFSLLCDEEYSQSLIRLFEMGAVRLSQFGEIRTVSQYLLQSIEDDKEFIYSALPLCYSQKRLTALMKRCLIYSDLSEIHGYIECARQRTDTAKDTLDQLFVELVDGVEQKSQLTIDQMEIVLENLYALLRTVLRVSALHDIYIYPRDPEEYKELKLSDILQAVINFQNVTDQPLFADAVKLLCGLEATKQGNNNRSVYIRDISGQAQQASLECRQYAQAIVDLCYNYACENSIRNISKHYNVNELLEHMPQKLSFQADFFARMRQYWNDGNAANERFQMNETNRFEMFWRWDRIPDFREAVRIAGCVDYKEETREQQIHRYEYEAVGQKRNQRRSVMCAILQKLFFAVLCILIAYVLEQVFNRLQDLFDIYFQFHAVIKTFVMLFLTEEITTVLSKRFPGMLTLSEAIGGIGRLLADAVHILGRKSSAYFNHWEQDVSVCEPYSMGKPIRYVTSAGLKKYIGFWKQIPLKQHQIYPVADVNKTEIVAELMRLEEVYHYHFGIVYESSYHRLIVDPIVTDEGRLFPYERMMPTNQDGVVILTRYKGKYLLLRQFRHAIRRDQYAFPRGFSDPGCTPEEDVRRELREELGAELVDEPAKLGRIVSDSGLTGGCAHVFLAEIKCYEQHPATEGIRRVVLLEQAELDEWVHAGKIDDGFTLGALALFQGL